MADGRLHCSVHVVRLTVDLWSLSICYHEPPFKLDPLKAAVNGLSLVQGGDLGTMAALCGNQAGPLQRTCAFLLAKEIEESPRCALNSSLRIDLDLRVTRWRERAPEREEVCE